jgi:hypothetical protein
MTDHPVARPVFAHEEGESMFRRTTVGRALKVLYGQGVHWHQVGYHVVYFTAGDMCGCHDCAALVQTIIHGPHDA